MRRSRFESLTIPFCLCLALAGCDLEGTSTDTTNTLTGVVVTSDGRAAAGAEVIVRSNVLIESPRGVFAWEVLGAMRADSLGRFSLKLPAKDSVYLEAEAFKETLSDTGTLSDTSKSGARPEIFFARYSTETIRHSGPLGSLKLSPVGSLQGRIVDTALNSLSNLRVCIVGLPIFGQSGAPDNAGGFSFHLDGVPAGTLELKALVILNGASGTLLYPGRLPEAEAKSGSPVDMGTLRFSD